MGLIVHSAISIINTNAEGFIVRNCFAIALRNRAKDVGNGAPAAGRSCQDP